MRLQLDIKKQQTVKQGRAARAIRLHISYTRMVGGVRNVRQLNYTVSYRGAEQLDGT